MRRPVPKRRCGHALIGLITESPVQATCPACRRRSSGCAAQRSRRTARRWRSGRPPPARSIRRLSEDGFVPTVLVNAFRMKLLRESIPFAALHARKNQEDRAIAAECAFIARTGFTARLPKRCARPWLPRRPQPSDGTAANPPQGVRAPTAASGTPTAMPMRPACRLNFELTLLTCPFPTGRMGRCAVLQKEARTVRAGNERRGTMEPSSIKKYAAETLGTFVLTLFGCGSAASGAGPGGHRARVRPVHRRDGVRHRQRVGLPHQPGRVAGAVLGQAPFRQGSHRLLGSAVRRGHRGRRRAGADHQPV